MFCNWLTSTSNEVSQVVSQILLPLFKLKLIVVQNINLYLKINEISINNLIKLELITLESDYKK